MDGHRNQAIDEAKAKFTAKTMKSIHLALNWLVNVDLC